jgi:hypothetical protein
MPLDAESRLVLIRVKSKWAEKQLRNLAAEILALQHTIVVERDKNTGVAPHPITFMWGEGFPKVPTISFDAVCLAGDIIHNLRAALDHLAQQLALIGCPTLTDKELRQIEFPIAETLTKYEADKARKVRGMRPEAVEEIDRLKPYKDGNDALWRIHELDNIDKHRTLFTCGPDISLLRTGSTESIISKQTTRISLDLKRTWRRILGSILRKRRLDRRIRRFSNRFINSSILLIV